MSLWMLNFDALWVQVQHGKILLIHSVAVTSGWLQVGS